MCKDERAHMTKRNFLGSYKVIFLLLGQSLWLFSCDEDRGCEECPFEKSFDKVIEESSEADSTYYSGKLSLELANSVTKIVGLKLEGSGTAGTREATITDTYKEIIANDPSITQRLNVYKEVACAYTKFYCKSNVLTDREKHDKMEQALKDFELNIHRVIQEKSVNSSSDLNGSSATPSSNNKEPFPQEPAVREEEVVKVSPAPVKTYNYLNSNQAYDLAILSGGSFERELGGGLRNHLDRLGYKTSRNVFNAKFLQDFGSKLWSGSFEGMSALGLSDKLNCICTIEANDLVAQKKTLEGRDYQEVDGTVHIQLYSLLSGEVLDYSIYKAGAGPSERSSVAIDDYFRKVTESQEFSQIPFHLCR